MLVSPSRGVPRILNYVLILCHLGSIAKAELLDSPLLAPSVSPFPQWKPAGDELPPPVRLPPVHRRHRKHFALPPEVEAAPRPNFGSFSVDGHPPSGSSHLARPSMRRSQFAAPSFALVPSAMGPNGSSVPSGSAQPPLSPHVSGCCEPHMVQRRGSRDCHCVYPIILELYLYNVSLSSNWSDVFLEELASQLGLKVTQFQITNFYVVGVRGLNLSMDLAPHTGISFPASEVYKMNYSLSMHMVRVDPNLVGDYSLLNLTWFKPPAPSPAPAVSLSPFSLPHSQSSQQASTDADSGKHQNLIVIIGIGAGILIIIVIFVLAICLCASRVGKKTVTVKETVKPRSVDALSVEGSLPHPASTRFLAYEELKEATNNFEAGSVLGEGGFGRVFKGVLSDGTAVAIKKLTNGGHQGDKEFLVEVEMLSRLHHRNLVKLVGYYSSRDASQHLLCYELVPNGSLEAWLHGPLGANCPLDWDTRMKIALDAARGLAYLHEDSQPCVIHRDFKASNILLENNFNAKVSDFGLAKQAPEGRANYLSTRVMGTFGYVAPEYAMTGHLLVKSDVYSYGVVLLELLTGRKPVDMSQPTGQENLVTWARPILRDKDRLEELADRRLEGKYPKDDFVRVCTIAAACVAPEAAQRPTMGEVVQSLKMVQRVTEYQDATQITSVRPNIRQSSTTYESDISSSMFSSGPISGLSGFDHEGFPRTTVFSEDLHEGR